MQSVSTRPRRTRQGRAATSGPDQGRSCAFCSLKVEEVDFTDVATLRRMITDQVKIRSRRVTGACRRHQNQIGVAVKRAREMALLPYVSS